MADFSLADVFGEIDKQAATFGVDPVMAKALAVAENTGSGSIRGKQTYSGSAVSPVGASGVMQVMPATAAGLQKAGFLPPDWKHDPSNLQTQVQAGLAAIKEKMSRMNDPSDPAEMASVYNGSSKTHQAYKAGNLAALPEETKQYTGKLRNAIMELSNAGAGRGTQGVAEAQAIATPGATRSSTTQSTRSTSTIYDPAAQSAFLNSILDVAGSDGQIDGSIQSLEEAAAKRASAAQELFKAISGVGEAKGAEAGAKAALQAGSAAKRAAILTSMNLDPSATANEMQKAFDVINQTDSKLVPLRADINARQQTNLFDDPVAWLVNKAVLPKMVKDFNNTAAVQKDAISRYKDLASIATTQQSLSMATDADGILRLGAAEAKVEAETAAAKHAQLKIEIAGAEIRDIQTMKSLQGQKLDLQLKALQIGKSTVTDSSGTAERDAEKKFQEQTFSNIKNMIVAAGGNPPESIQQLKLLTPKKREALIQAATSGTFGENFAESFNFVWENGNRANLAEKGGAGVVQWIQGTAGEASKLVGVQSAAAAQMRKQFDGKKALPEVLNAMQSKYEEEAATNMRGASKFNPLRVDYKIAAGAPELKNNMMAQWLQKFGPGGTEETMKEIDENHVLKKFAQSVTEGQTTPAVAAQQISEFYKIATIKQAKATNYPMFGISKPSKTYQVQFDGLGKDLMGVDLGDPAQVETALTRKIVADKAKQYWDNLKISVANPLAGGVMAASRLAQQSDPLADLFGNRK